MNPQPKVLFRSFIALLFLMVASSSLTLAQTTDSNQDQTYGVWKVPNPQTPGIQFRAKCDRDSAATGRMVSEWSYQFRNTYKGTTDFIYLNEAGIAQPPVDKMIGPFLATLKPGEISSNGAQLYGSCSAHATPTTGIHVTIKCAVPTGQDAPCFKDANGNPYPKALAGSSVTGARHSNAASSGSARKSGPALTQAYWFCTIWYWNGDNQGHDYVISDVFKKGVEPEVLASKLDYLGATEGVGAEYARKFYALAKERHPDWDEGQGHYFGQSACRPFATSTEAELEREKTIDGDPRFAALPPPQTWDKVQWIPK